MGGTTAFLKILGSTDMHFDNVTCYGGKPYILDLETIIKPVEPNDITKGLLPELSEALIHSPYYTNMLPYRQKELELSPCMNTDEKGLAPLAGGEKVMVFRYLDFFLEGYHAAYQSALERREELADALRNFPSDMPIRILVRNSQYYFDIMKRLYHHDSLATAASHKKSEEILSKLLYNQLNLPRKKYAASELEQIKRGDIPYFYTTAKSRSIFSDGMEIIKDAFEKSAAEHALENLYAMGEADERFDRAFLERSMHGYCSGAPGIGIMIARIKGMGFTGEKIEKLSQYAKSAADTLPLNERDHLCCGNSAIAEYHLTAGNHEEAGKVLGAMYERCLSEGDYRYQNYDHNNGQTPSLFYGMSGIGYEMLRYAFPEKILSIL
ncbi:MAG: DUF4135 domain-containing protein [Treponema sp.]|nr:DUF4135 domain-containing protein [Treponema sp.]